MTRKVALYTRVSTKDQDCARQVRDLEAWAARMGWTIVARYTEKASGAKADRASRADAMRAHASYDAILVTEPSRWSRSLIDLVATLGELQQRGVSLLSLNGLSMDMSTPAGRMMVGVMGSLAEFERDLIRERIASGMANAKAKGRYVGGGIKGNTPQQRRHRDAIINLRREGVSIRGIASKLSISPGTVKSVLSVSSNAP